MKIKYCTQPSMMNLIIQEKKATEKQPQTLREKNDNSSFINPDTSKSAKTSKGKPITKDY